MIVHQTTEGWQIIYHRAHALLAAQLAGQWWRKDSLVRLYETIAAISHHDDLAKEWEGNFLTEAGTPLDFSLTDSTSVKKPADHVQTALYRGRWVALLISRHMTYLNGGKQGETPEIDQFLQDQHTLQQSWQQQLGISQADVDAAYNFLQWCDRLSLILCQQQIPEDSRRLEISIGPDGKRYDIYQRKDSLLSVVPWPFEDDKFTVNVEASCVSQVTFSSDEELTRALQQAPIQVLEWTFIKDD